MKRVFYAILPERCVYDVSFVMAQAIAYECGRASNEVVGYIPIYPFYNATDVSRQLISDDFLNLSSMPEDTLVMLDVDHDHPSDIVIKLAADNLPVVAALCFRRTPGYETCAFRRAADGRLLPLASVPEQGIYQMDALGTGAIAIQRWVLQKIRAAGVKDFFRSYNSAGRRIGEDFYFSELCSNMDIPLYLDTGIESPHLTIGFVDRQTHADHLADHPGEGTVSIATPRLR